jgi:Invasin, domain 3
MKTWLQLLPALLVLAVLNGPARATVLLDDTWSTGVRTLQSLPAHSAWFASTTSSLTAATGSMSGSPSSTSSRLWLTYYTSSATAPASLAPGQTLKLSLTFNATGIIATTTNTTTVRLGLFNYAAGATRVAADAFSSNDGNGVGVQGYSLFINFLSTFSTGTPLAVKKRTTLNDTNLVGRSADYTEITPSGPSGQSGKPGFISGTTYTLVYAVTANAGSADITTIITGGGLNLSNTVTDTSSPITNFDAFAIRPENSTESAATFQFTEMKMELLASGVVQQAPSAAFCNIAASTAVTNADGLSTVSLTVTERDAGNNLLTNSGVAPVLASTLGTVSGITAQGNGLYKATLTAGTKPGGAVISGTISGAAIGTNANVYLAGKPGVFQTGAGFFSGTYNLGFTDTPGQSFSVWSSANPALPMAQWTRETDLATANQTMYETVYAGQPSAYSFTVQPPAAGQIFYRISSP